MSPDCVLIALNALNMNSRVNEYCSIQTTTVESVPLSKDHHF